MAINFSSLCVKHVSCHNDLTEYLLSRVLLVAALTPMHSLFASLLQMAVNALQLRVMQKIWGSMGNALVP